MANYRILRISRVEYRSVFAEMFAAEADLADAGFARQMQAFFDRSLVYSDSFARAMLGLGNEAIEIVCNAERIQKTWAKEHNTSYSEADWNREIVLAQIAEWRPDVVYIQGLSSDPESFNPPADFRERFPFVKLVVAYSGSLHERDQVAGIDLLVASPPSICRWYREAGMHAELVYHSFDPVVLDRLARHAEGPEIAFSFAGSSGLGFKDVHIDRYWELVELALATPLRLWSYERLDRIGYRLLPEQVATLRREIDEIDGKHGAAAAVQALRAVCRDSFGHGDPVFPLSTLFPERCHAPVFGLDMFDLLRRSRLTFNRHSDTYAVTAGNIRCFEATGVGTCMLTNDAPNLRELFEPDSEVVVFASTEEAIDKARYLLDHPAEARRIAEAGHRRTLAEHTVERRVDQIDHLIRRALAGDAHARLTPAA